ncbi:sulfatase-like hydrolase/transferase [bacterium]|jgi:arylsulfatase A-like enzyme|nr:sulfatase-like hydrolase/transferase [bacterium]
MNAIKTLVTGLFLLSLTATGAAKPPNIVFLFTDDQRFDSFGALGNPDVKTPKMDSLIERGTLFTQAYIQGSMVGMTCLPSRAMIMSGKSLFRAPMQLDTGLLLPQALRQGGYKTFATGKWHNGRESFLNCFDEAEAVFLGGAAGSHVNVPLNYRKGEEMVPYQVLGIHASVLFADATIEYLKAQQGTKQPFFCYVPFTAPHSPHTPPGDFATMYNPKELTLPPNHPSANPLTTTAPQRRGRNRDPKTSLAAYYGMVSHLDEQVGRILDAIDTYGHRDDTIILLATDHGFSLGSHGEHGKANGYEHGSRSIMSFSGPGIPQGKRTPAFAYLLDIYPTLCELAHLPIPEDPEGMSLARVIHGKHGHERDTLFTAFMADQRTIRDARWKLFSRLNGGGLQLFDLLNDPHELNDRSSDSRSAPIIEQLQAKLELARIEAGDTPARVSDMMRNQRGRRGQRSRGAGPTGRGPSRQRP